MPTIRFQHLRWKRCAVFNSDVAQLYTCQNALSDLPGKESEEIVARWEDDGYCSEIQNRVSQIIELITAFEQNVGLLE